MVPRETGGTFSGHGNQIRYKWVPQVHIRYRAKKYLAETKFRMADCITQWRIVLRGLEGLTQDLTTFSTHRGNMKWRVQSMGHQSSPAVYVAMVTDSLNRFGLCGGSRHDASKGGYGIRLEYLKI